jgi:excisionase family DNA binding protein
MERQTLTVTEAGQVLGLSRNAAYDAAKRGDLPVIRFGKRLLVPRAALDQLLNGRTKVAAFCHGPQLVNPLE